MLSAQESGRMRVAASGVRSTAPLCKEDWSMKRAHVLAAALAALLLVPAIAEAARDRRPSPQEILHSPRLLARYLNLTDAQKAQVEPLFTTLNNTLRSIHEQEKQVREQLVAELAKPS